MLTSNDSTYLSTLRKLLAFPADKNHDGISHEIINANVVFQPNSVLSCIDKNYVNAEIEWYMSQSLSIDSNPVIAKTKIWNNICSDSRKVNSNYGWCVFSRENCKQYNNAIEALRQNKTSKHAVMMYSRPSIVDEWNDNEHAKHDMICTIYTQAHIRNGHLVYIVNMRSNDVWFGMRNDLTWHMFIQAKMADELGVRPGLIFWNAGSLHVYEFAHNLIKKRIKEVYNEDIGL